MPWVYDCIFTLSLLKFEEALIVLFQLALELDLSPPMLLKTDSSLIESIRLC